ncbi:MAG: PQQ-like beta-propeller repeat protein [Peptococcaceae bacterium]|nr:PQQ-like beta-propeller repeat protein [Peptococcaceae bacterium]
MWETLLNFNSEIWQLGVHPNGNIYAYDLGENAVWVLSPDGQVKHRIPFRTGSLMYRSIPPFQFSKDGNVFFGAPDGQVYCVAPNGHILWQTMTGQQDPTQTTIPVTSLALCSKHGILAVANSLSEHRPIQGLDIRTGQILWKYKHSKFTVVYDLTTDEDDNIVVTANDPAVIQEWLSTDPSAPTPDFSALPDTKGGAVIVLSPSGHEKGTYPVPNEFCLRLTMPHKGRYYVVGSSVVELKRGAFKSTEGIFALASNGSVIWSSIRKDSVMTYSNHEGFWIQAGTLFYGNDVGQLIGLNIQDGSTAVDYTVSTGRPTGTVKVAKGDDEGLCIIAYVRDITFGWVPQIFCLPPNSLIHISGTRTSPGS